jgi:hypothetical protein
MKKVAASLFAQRQMADSLLGQAALCDKIAAACAKEEEAAKFKKLARECREAAAAA